MDRSASAALGLLLLLVSAPARGQQQLPADLAAGPHPVGFTVREPADSSRRYGEGTARPIRMYLWYPAGPGGTPMRYRDYLGEPVERFVARLEQAPEKAASPETIERLLDRPMGARRDAPALPGRRPLVLFGNGMNAPAYLYSVLCEYLASQGYAVAAIPSMGTAPGRALPFDTTGIATQVADLEFALRAAGGLPFADTSRVALAAWSVGGVSTAVVASRHPSVRALLSLDAASGYVYGIDLLRQMGYDLERFRTPYMHLKGAREGRFVVPRTDTFFTTLSARAGFRDAYEVTVPGLQHHHFTVLLGLLSPSEPEGERWQEVQEGTATAWRFALAFLDRYARGVPGENDYLRPAARGPGGAAVRAATGPPAGS